MKTKPIKNISYARVAFLFIISGILLIILSSVSIFFPDFNIFGFSISNSQFLGAFGEYIGGLVGSIWSLAGIILFYEALRFQRSELKLQREELKSQREEIMEQTNQYILQNQTLMTRRLEETFFQLISMHNEITSSLKIPTDSKLNIYTNNAQITGRYCFQYYYKYFQSIYSENIDLTGITSVEETELRKLIKESLKLFYNDFQEDLGHYFRNLINIMTYIEKSKLTDKKFYLNILHSLLTNYELLLLFYYCLSDYGKEMKEIIEDHSFFKQFPDNELFDRRHKDFYRNLAFGLARIG